MHGWPMGSQSEAWGLNLTQGGFWARSRSGSMKDVQEFGAGGPAEGVMALAEPLLHPPEGHGMDARSGATPAATTLSRSPAPDLGGPRPCASRGLLVARRTDCRCGTCGPLRLAPSRVRSSSFPLLPEDGRVKMLPQRPSAEVFTSSPPAIEGGSSLSSIVFVVLALPGSRTSHAFNRPWVTMRRTLGRLLRFDGQAHRAGRVTGWGTGKLPVRLPPGASLAATPVAHAAPSRGSPIGGLTLLQVAGTPLQSAEVDPPGDRLRGRIGEGGWSWKVSTRHPGTGTCRLGARTSSSLVGEPS